MARARRLALVLAAAASAAACDPKTTTTAPEGPAPDSAPVQPAQDAEAGDAPAPEGKPVNLVEVSRAAPAAERLAGNILVAGRAMQYLRDLTDLHPTRVTSTEGHEGAAQWATQAFREAGLVDARIEPFTISHGWERRPATAAVVAPTARALDVKAAGWFRPRRTRGSAASSCTRKISAPTR